MATPFPFFKKNAVNATGALKVDAIFATDNSPAMSAFQGWLADNTVVTSLNEALISERIGKVDLDDFNVALSNRFSYTRMDASQTVKSQYYIEVVFLNKLNPLLGTITPDTYIDFNYNNNVFGGYPIPSSGKRYKIAGIVKEKDIDIVNAVYDSLTQTVTVTTDVEHNYIIDDEVIISGVYPPTYNNTSASYVITEVSTFTFTYEVSSNPGLYQNNGKVFKLSNSLLLNEYLSGRAIAAPYANGATSITVSSVEGTISNQTANLQTIIAPNFPVGTRVLSYNAITGVINLSAAATAGTGGASVSVSFEIQKINQQNIPTGSVVLPTDNANNTTLNTFYFTNAGEVITSRLISNLSNYYVYGDLRLKYFWANYVDPSITTTYDGWNQNVRNDGYNTLFTTGDPDTGTQSQMVITDKVVTSNEDTFNNIIKTLTTTRNNAGKVVDEFGYNPRSKAALLFISASNEQGSISATNDTSRGNTSPGFPVRKVVQQIKSKNGYWIGIIGGDKNDENVIQVYNQASSDGVEGDDRGFVPIYGQAEQLIPGVMISSMTWNSGIITITTYYNHNLNKSTLVPVKFGKVGTFSFTGSTTVPAQGGQVYTISNLNGSASGIGATAVITRDNNGTITSIVFSDPGERFVNGETITIPAASYGGSVNLVITLTSIVNETVRIRVRNSYYTDLSGIRTATVTGFRTLTIPFAENIFSTVLPPTSPSYGTLGYVLGIDMLFSVPTSFYRKSTLTYVYPSGDTRAENAAFQDRKDILVTTKVFESTGLLQFFNSSPLGDFYLGLPGDPVNGTNYVAYNISSGSSDIKLNFNVKNSIGTQSILGSILDTGTTLVEIKQNYVFTLFVNEISATGITASSGATVITIPKANIVDLNPLNTGGGNLGRSGITTVQTDHILDGPGTQPRTGILSITDLGSSIEVTLNKALTSNITSSDTIYFSYQNIFHQVRVYVNTKNNFKDLDVEVSFPGYGYYGNGLIVGGNPGDTLTSSQITNPTIPVSNDPGFTFWTFETEIATNGIIWSGLAAPTDSLVIYDVSGDGDPPSIGINADFRVFRNTNGTYDVFLISPGINYDVDDIITIPGTSLGGTSPANNLLITVTRVLDTSYVTLTTAQAHGFVPPLGRSDVKISVKNMIPSAYNGVYEATVLDEFTLKFNKSVNPGIVSVGGTVRNVSLDVINDTFSFLNQKLFFTMSQVSDVQYPFKVDILTAVVNGANIQVTTVGPHGLVNGEEYAIGGIRNSTTSSWNVPKTVVTVTGANTFTYPAPAGSLGVYVYGGYVSDWDIIVFGGVYTNNFDRVIFLNVGDQTKDGIPPQKSKDYLVRQVNFRQLNNEGVVVGDGPKKDFFVINTNTLAISDRCTNAGAEIQITASSWNKQLVTVTTAVEHRLFPGNTVDINGFANAQYNSASTGDIVVSTPSPTTFTYQRLTQPSPLEPTPVAASFTTEANNTYLGPSGGNPPASRDIIKFSNTNGIPGVDPDQDYYVRTFSNGSGQQRYATFQISPEKRGTPISFFLLVNNTTFNDFTNKITVSTFSPHYLATGNTITISGITDNLYNGTYTIDVISPTIFNYTPSLPFLVAATAPVVNTTRFTKTVSATNATSTKLATNSALNVIGSTVVQLRTSGGGSTAGLTVGNYVDDGTAATGNRIPVGTTLISIDSANTRVTLSQPLIGTYTQGGSNAGNDITFSSNVAGARTIALNNVTGLGVGMLVTGLGTAAAKIPTGSYIVSINATLNVIQISNALTSNLTVTSESIQFDDNVTGSYGIKYTSSTGTLTLGSRLVGTNLDIDSVITSVDTVNSRVVVSQPILSTISGGTYTIKPSLTSSGGQIQPTSATLTNSIIQNQITSFNGQVQLTGDALGWDHPLLAKETGGALFFQLGFVKGITPTLSPGGNNFNQTTLFFNTGFDNSGLVAGDWVYGEGIAPGSTIVGTSNTTITLDKPTINTVNGLIGFARPGQVSIFPKYTQEFGRILGKTFAEWLFKIA